MYAKGLNVMKSNLNSSRKHGYKLARTPDRNCDLIEPSLDSGARDCRLGVVVRLLKKRLQINLSLIERPFVPIRSHFETVESCILIV